MAETRGYYDVTEWYSPLNTFLRNELQFADGKGARPDYRIDKIATLPPEVEAEAVASLPFTAEIFPVADVHEQRGFFVPLHVAFEHDGGDRCRYAPFARIAFFLGVRRAAAARPILTRVFREHASPDARLIAGHALRRYDDPALRPMLVDGYAIDKPGWFYLWCSAQIALESPRPARGERSFAYEAIADQLASRPELPLAVALRAASDHELADPRLGELVAPLVARTREEGWLDALELLTRLGDRRHESVLLGLADDPSLRGMALDMLQRLLGAEMIPLVLPAMRRSEQHPIDFIRLFRSLGPDAADALREAEALAAALESAAAPVAMPATPPRKAPAQKQPAKTPAHKPTKKPPAKRRTKKPPAKKPAKKPPAKKPPAKKPAKKNR